MNKHLKTIIVFSIIILVIFILLNPFLDVYKYKKNYIENPSEQTLFDLCNVAAYCYNYSDFFIYSKQFFDNYGVVEIKNIYEDIDSDEADKIYDVFLAEFLVKSTCQKHISQEEFNKYVFLFHDDAYFIKVLVEYVDKYCLGANKIKLFLDFLNNALESTTNFTQKMMIYTVQVYLYDELNDKESLEKAINNSKSIAKDYYSEKSESETG